MYVCVCVCVCVCGLPLHGPGDVLEVVQGMLVGSPRRECVCECV